MRDTMIKIGTQQINQKVPIKIALESKATGASMRCSISVAEAEQLMAILKTAIRNCTPVSDMDWQV